MNKDKRKKRKNKKQGAKQGKSTVGRRLRKRTIAALVAVLAFVGGMIAATLSGSLEHLVPVDPVVDKAAGSADAIKVASVDFDKYWPTAFEDSAKAQSYVRKLNSGAAPSLTATPEGGVPVTSDNSAIVHLRGNREQTIRITNIRIEPIEKLPPVKKTLVCPSVDKGGGGDNEILDFDLDSTDSVGYSVDASFKRTSIPYFEKRTVTLAKNETVGFLMRFHTSAHHVRFSMTVDYQYGTDAHGSVKVDDHGKPFEFTPLQRKSAERLWIPAPTYPLVTEVDPATNNTVVSNC
ncbi:hypothetical protein [Kribbella kalugense]|uniref:Uncharacterized protein n=1 Tax=Kribbella kalugense TaxID=2512221 RepID=A0A4R8A078_9ACTN|nr:hypothetical protein [Kribbella kalugense]TDW22658.1 hypothetical protein EV650_1495 [Kribbella kalugense]